MSNYPSWWNTQLTIYNKYEDPQTNIITWYRTVVKNCFWKYTNNKIVFGNIQSKAETTIMETNDTICRIPKNSKFRERNVWLNISNSQKSNYFTLGAGDIIVKGSVTDTINEYQTGQRSTDLITKYKNLQGCIEISKYALNVDGGRANEHYYVKGN